MLLITTSNKLLFKDLFFKEKKVTVTHLEKEGREKRITILIITYVYCRYVDISIIAYVIYEFLIHSFI